MVGFAPRLNWFGWAAVIGCWIFCGPVADGVCAQMTSDGDSQSTNQVQTDRIYGRHCKLLYVGIVGGLTTPNNRRSGVVQIRDALLSPTYTDVCARTFSPYHWMAGRNWILDFFPRHPGAMTEVELEKAPKVVLVGHSLGGWAVLSVARGLDEKGIPVELTIQVDSVGITDHTVPKNVKEAAIFHARDILMFLTTKKISAQDASQTKLVADLRVKGAGHESIARDARIRELVIRKAVSLGADATSAERSQHGAAAE
jgi:hypothetical protein